MARNPSSEMEERVGPLERYPRSGRSLATAAGESLTVLSSSTTARQWKTTVDLCGSERRSHRQSLPRFESSKYQSSREVRTLYLACFFAATALRLALVELFLAAS